MYHHHKPSTILPNRHGFVKGNGHNAWPTTPMRLRKSSRKSTSTTGREQAIWWRLCWERSPRNRPWPNRSQRIRREAAVPLRAPQPRPLQVRLLCGLVLFVSTWYCAPRGGKRGTAPSVEQQAGLYPELAALGFGKGCSPALQYTVARIVALSPSIAVAQKELARQGIHLDQKAVRRIAEQLGTQLLALRQRELLAWRAGQLPAGNEFAGRRVVVQIDGGRVRLRENQKRQQKRRRRKGQREKFDTPWREPKVLTIFEIDERGKMTKKHQQPLIDGTLLGPDHLAELVAYHLHRLGVAQAELVVFVSDGARWIWDRLDWIERRAGLDPSRTVHVLDFCHAAHHVSLALQTLGWDETAAAGNLWPVAQAAQGQPLGGGGRSVD